MNTAFSSLNASIILPPVEVAPGDCLFVIPDADGVYHYFHGPRDRLLHALYTTDPLRPRTPPTDCPEPEEPENIDPDRQGTPLYVFFVFCFLLTFSPQ
jgi:hypothetical protein